MMNDIKISEGLFIVYLATEEKWAQRVAHIATINGLEYSLVPENADWGINVVVSELTSGTRLYKEWIDPFTFASCDTKEKTLVVLKEVAENAAQKIKKYNSDYFDFKISEALEKVLNNLGPMPENKIPYFEEEL